jgi:hypothetical protein
LTKTLDKLDRFENQKEITPEKKSFYLVLNRDFLVRMRRY